ncbi:MAG: hypothetical protein TV41_07535 [Wolbachia endosymbiont of Dactylopius coccus]|nr:MAG: hypothetical protein TV41_07535 [Wolbachia endosymbiont of Dactylopius coccus]
MCSPDESTKCPRKIAIEYNKFLEARGNIFHFINKAVENWYKTSKKLCENNIYSDKIVISVHIIANLFRIDLR